MLVFGELAVQLRHHALGEQLGVVLGQLLAHVAELHEQHQVADVQVGREFVDLLHHFVRRADHQIPGVHQVLHLGRPRLRARGGGAHLAGETEPHGGFGGVAGRGGKARIDVQAADEEVFGGLGVQLDRLWHGIPPPRRSVRSRRDMDCGPCPVGPSPPSSRPSWPCRPCGRSRTGTNRRSPSRRTTARSRSSRRRDPHRRMRTLDRARPDVDVALLVVAAVERESVRMLPGLHHQVVRLVVALAELRRVLAVGEAVVHRRADREAGDQPAAGDAVDHRELFGDAGRRVVQRQRVAHHADRRVGGATGQRRGDQVGRRHQAVAVGVVLVDADRIEAAGGGVFEFVHEVVVHVVGAAGVEQRGVDVDPDRGVLLPEVVRKFGVWH